MTTTNGDRRVQRPLTDDDLGTVLAAINAATNTAELLNHAVRGIFTALLSDHGASINDLGPDNWLNPSDYAIPNSQWTAIVQAIADRAEEWGTGALLTFDLINVMPAGYDDPHVPAPTIERIDRRPHLHTLHVSREATDVIAACEAHLQALGTHYGHQSTTYLDALHSWHRNLSRLFSMRFGAETRVSRDGDLSLFLSTASGFVYGIIFHGAWRHCTAKGCTVTIRDDGSWYPTHRDAPVIEHEHTSSYPLDAPRPGSWSFHS